jgi:predicted nucleotidyltransferase
METKLPEDFKEFLKLLNDHDVAYLLIGGYAVGYHGYPRTTADMDIWVKNTSENASKLLEVFHEFGMHDPTLTHRVFQEPGKIIRMGLPPMRIEVMNQIDGVEFDACDSRKIVAMLDGIRINLIGREDLRVNKKASGRYKDLDDLEHLS